MDDGEYCFHAFRNAWSGESAPLSEIAIEASIPCALMRNKPPRSSFFSHPAGVMNATPELVVCHVSCFRKAFWDGGLA